MFPSQTINENERYLQEELREVKEENQQLRDEAQRQREDEQQEWDDRRYEQRRTAQTWPEALGKQASLCAAEASLWSGDMAENFPDDYFGPMAKACDRALEIWNEVEASKKDRIRKLEAQIEAIKDEIKQEVADRLESENKAPGWQGVVTTLREDEDLDNWLNW